MKCHALDNDTTLAISNLQQMPLLALGPWKVGSMNSQSWMMEELVGCTLPCTTELLATARF